MAKRMSESSLSLEAHDKYQRYSNDDDQNVLKRDVVIQNEIIPLAVIHLKSIEDVKSSFLVSKTVRDGIFAQPNVMKRFKITLIDVDKKDAVRFLIERGYSIRYLDILVDWNFGKSMKYFLYKLDKLKELSLVGDDYESDDEDELVIDSKDIKVADLSCLSILKVHHISDLRTIMKNSTNLSNLTELTMKFNDNDDDNHDVIADFLCQQTKLLELDFEDSSDDFEFPNRNIDKSIKFRLKKLRMLLWKIHQDNFISFLSIQASNLQVLELEVTDTEAFNFPSRDISNEVKLNLKVLKFSYPNIHRQNFTAFLRTQALCLQELELTGISYLQVFEMIFSTFKVLEKLTIDEEGSDIIYHDDFPQDLSLESLKHFHDKNQNGTVVKKLIKLFPNIQTLKCCDTMQAEGTAETLTTLDTSEIYWPRITSLKMPNLQNLFIKKIDKCDDDYYWTHFAANFLNVENIQVEKVGYEHKDILRFVKRLKLFTKLKTFKLRHGNAINHDYNLDDNERVGGDEKFYKILIDTTSKTVKLSTYLVQKCGKEMRKLRETFKDFEFFEFCFEELRIERISN